MGVVAGKYHKSADKDDFDHALGSPEADGNGMKVTVFPEPGAQYDVHHNVPEGKDSGQFSKD